MNVVEPLLHLRPQPNLGGQIIIDNYQMHVMMQNNININRPVTN